LVRAWLRRCGFPLPPRPGPWPPAGAICGNGSHGGGRPKAPLLEPPAYLIGKRGRAAKLPISRAVRGPLLANEGAVEEHISVVIDGDNVTVRGIERAEQDQVARNAEFCREVESGSEVSDLEGLATEPVPLRPGCPFVALRGGLFIGVWRVAPIVEDHFVRIKGKREPRVHGSAEHVAERH
jgi:hypothetical protein